MSLNKKVLDFEVKDRQLNVIIQGLPSERPGQNAKSNAEFLFEKKWA
jgi:hypothetical protein